MVVTALSRNFGFFSLLSLSLVCVVIPCSCVGAAAPGEGENPVFNHSILEHVSHRTFTGCFLIMNTQPACRQAELTGAKGEQEQEGWLGASVLGGVWKISVIIFRGVL